MEMTGTCRFDFQPRLDRRATSIEGRSADTLCTRRSADNRLDAVAVRYGKLTFSQRIRFDSR
jgi:hypothetical protein